MEDAEIRKLVQEAYPAFTKHLYKILGYIAPLSLMELEEWEIWKEHTYRQGEYEHQSRKD